MKKHLSEEATLLLFSAGVLGTSLVIGLIVFYEFDKIF